MSNSLTPTTTSNGSGMSFAGVTGSALGTELTQLLMCDDMQPGSDLSYQLAKTIYIYHPVGAKMVDEPINVAQSQQRTISIPRGPEERVREAFLLSWSSHKFDGYIAGAKSTSRIYGKGALAYGATKPNGDKIPTNKAIDPFDLPDMNLYLTVLDPLNTASSQNMVQDPNDPMYQQTIGATVQGETYHPSRVCTVINERPLFIEYTNSSYGYTGRSVFQRALFPLKSFVRTMITDDMVAVKAGVLIAKMEGDSSPVWNKIISAARSFNRSVLQQATTNNVISVKPNEAIETLNMMNLDGAYGMARKNILENIASAGGMPSIMLNSETFAEGFGEGTEDAKKVAGYINRIRMEMQPIYAFCDRLNMHLAWTPAFYETIQADFPEEYGEMDYKTAFYQWKNSFTAEWPSLLIEPESERSKGEDVKLRAIIAMLEVLLPEVDPENKAILIEWSAENFNSLKLLFTTPLLLDMDALKEFAQQAADMAQKTQEAAIAPPDQEPGEPKPEGATT